MTNVTRRGLLGMFAAGVGAAIMPSGVIMPVRKIIVPQPWPKGIPADAHWFDPSNVHSMWQDAAMTIPAVNPGDPVMVATRICMFNGVYVPQTADDPTTAPTLCFAPDGTPGLAFDHRRGKSMTAGIHIGRRSAPLPVQANLYSLSITRPT